MLFELALLMVAVAASYWGVMMVRRRPGALLGWMLGATGAAAWVSYLTRGHDGDATPALDVVGAAAIFAGAILLVIGPAVRRATRWAVATDRLRLAAVLVEIGDVLQPGTAGPDDKASLAALRDVRAGEVDGAVSALRAARAKAPAELRRAFDERIALLYVVAMRWSDAVTHAEATLFPTTPAVPADAKAEPEQVRAPIDVARALGMSPAVWVELTAAYGRLGKLDRAAEMAEAFDRAAVGAAGMAWLVHRVRLVYLAAAGRVEPVRRLLAQRAARQVRPASRLYWSALAAERAGDRAAARADYQAALDKARRVPKVEAAIRSALDELDRTAPASLSPEAARIADDLAATDVVLPAPPPGAGVRVAPLLVAANAAVAVVTALVIGSPGDIGAVVRAGANVRGAVDAGEWWRVPASVFVHIGWVHLIVNLVGLWSLARIADGVYGSARTFAIYACAGLGGALALHAFGSGGVAAGASGAIFGLLGALLVELAIAGHKYPRAGRNALIGALVFVGLVQVSMGLFYAAIGHWGHAVGLAIGAAAGLGFSPRGPAAAVRHWIARAVAGAAALLFAGALALAALTPYHATLARYGTATRTLRGVAIDVPGNWVVDGDFLADPDRIGELTAVRVPGPLAAAFESLRNGARAQAKELGFEDIVAADDRTVSLPRDWSSSELVATVEDDLGATQRIRVILFAHAAGADTVLGMLFMPEILARDADAALATVITSARPGPLPKVAPPAPPR